MVLLHCQPFIMNTRTDMQANTLLKIIRYFKPESLYLETDFNVNMPLRARSEIPLEEFSCGFLFIYNFGPLKEGG